MMAESRRRENEALVSVEYGDEPSLLALSDSEDGLERLRSLGERAGCRVAAATLIESVTVQNLQMGTDAVIAQLRADSGAAMDTVLGRLRIDAEAGRRPSVIGASLEVMDFVFASAFHPAIEPLCEPTDRQWLKAIALATRRTPTVLNDVGKGPARLQQLSEEVGRIADILASLSVHEAAARGSGAGNSNQGPPVDAGHIRAVIRARRLREQFFRSELLADPAWDMLLDLMAARLEGQRVAVSSLCIAAAVPPTTALRWIKALCEDGLFVRVADPADGRRVFIELSDAAADALSAYFAAAQRHAVTTI